MRILIVEDDPEISALLTDFLREAGYATQIARDGLTALREFSRQEFQLVLLDVLLPELDGFGVCRQLRERSDVPIIMLTALDDEQSQTLGFDLMVDDYVTKPFSLPVLVRRVGAVLRRSAGNCPVLSCGPLRLDVEGYTARLGDVPLDLTPREFELLRELMMHRGRVMTRDNLLDSLWQNDFDADPRTVDAHVKNIRAKLGTSADLIRTVRGVGYKMCDA